MQRHRKTLFDSCILCWTLFLPSRSQNEVPLYKEFDTVKKRHPGTKPTIAVGGWTLLRVATWFLLGRLAPSVHLKGTLFSSRRAFQQSSSALDLEDVFAELTPRLVRFMVTLMHPSWTKIPGISNVKSRLVNARSDWRSEFDWSLGVIC